MCFLVAHHIRRGTHQSTQVRGLTLTFRQTCGVQWWKTRGMDPGQWTLRPEELLYRRGVGGWCGDGKKPWVSSCFNQFWYDFPSRLGRRSLTWDGWAQFFRRSGRPRTGPGTWFKTIRIWASSVTVLKGRAKNCLVKLPCYPSKELVLHEKSWLWKHPQLY